MGNVLKLSLTMFCCSRRYITINSCHCSVSLRSVNILTLVFIFRLKIGDHELARVDGLLVPDHGHIHYPTLNTRPNWAGSEHTFCCPTLLRRLGQHFRQVKIVQPSTDCGKLQYCPAHSLTFCLLLPDKSEREGFQNFD